MAKVLAVIVGSVGAFALLLGLCAMRLGELLYPEKTLTANRPLSLLFAQESPALDVFGFGMFRAGGGAAPIFGTLLAVCVPTRPGRVADRAEPNAAPDPARR